MNKIWLIALISILLGTVSCSKDDDEDKTVYTVTFDTDGGSPAPSVQKVEKGNQATAPSTNPAKTGYTFVFWHVSGATTAYNFQTPVNSDITLYAKWTTEKEDNISLNKTSLELRTTDRERLTVTGATTITWSTSNKDVAIVNNQGVVTATGVGKAVITATAGSKSASSNVEVSHSVITGTGTVIWKNGEKIEIKNYNAPKTINSLFVYEGNIYVTGTRTDITSGGTTTTEYSQAVVIKVESAIKDEPNTLIFTDQLLELKANASYGNDLFIASNGDIYVAGYGIATNQYNNYYRQALLWKNGKLQLILSNSDVSQNAAARSVFVAGNDVYAVGNNGYWADDVVWKNDQPEILNRPPGDVTRVKANSVFVSGGDVYVAGAVYYYPQTFRPKAVLWKNNTPVVLNTARDTELYSVFVSGDDVYAVSGQDLWKNNVSVFNESSTLSDVCVYDHVVYVVSNEGLWINDVKQSWGAGNAVVVK